METTKFISKIPGILEISFNRIEDGFFLSTFKFVTNFTNYSKRCDLIFNDEEKKEIIEIVYEYLNNKEVEGTLSEQASSAGSLVTAIDIYLKNQEEINEPLRITTNAISIMLSRMIFAPSGGNSGCYIATMAYGHYEHPQVIILRQYRDTVLAKSRSGRLFIKTYYLYSPQLVEILKNRKLINIFIRKSLNQFIKLIK
jgi:hypothetical protein